jgi:glycosyltransferase involved in cell wall biosynthesis
MPLNIAGTEIYVETLALLQQQAGNHVAVLIPHINHYRPEEINEHYVYNGINVYQYLETADPTNRDYIYGNKKPAGLDNFTTLIKLLQPDVIHFHELNRSIGLGVEHVKLAKLSGAKIFLTMHLSSYTCNTNTLIQNSKLCSGKILPFTCSVCTFKTMFKLPAFIASPLAAAGVALKQTGITPLLPVGKATTVLAMPVNIKRIKSELNELSENIDQFITLTAWYRKVLLINQVKAEKVTLIPQALPLVNGNMFQKNNHISTLPVKMVFVGRIHPQKGLHLIIEAMRYFTPQQVSIDIYGMPEETMYYNKCISDSLAIENIIWKGVFEREAIITQLYTYDILCLPSTFSEMSPLVIQEAFAAGIPVLASNVYGNMEQITGGKNGLLFDFNSANSLKEQIDFLLSKPSVLEEMKRNITTPVSFENVYESYMTLYNSN